MSGSAKSLIFEILAIDGASQVFHKVGTSAEEASAKVKASGTAFSGLGGVGAMALAGMGAGAVALGAKVVHMAADFQSGLNLLVTSANESPKALHMVGEGIKQISVETATSTKQLLSGMYMIESAGFHGASGLNILRAAAQGAKAEGADLGTVGNALTTYMKDFHLSADQSVPAMNGLIATVAQGKMRMEDLAGALHSVLPIAAAAKLSYAQVGGAIATMTSHGVSAELATQHLAFLIRSLQAPSNVAAAEMGRWGLSAQDVAQHLGERGLTGTLDLLMTAITKHMGPAGTLLYNTFNESKDAAASAKAMLAGMPPDLRKLAEAYQSGSMSAKDYSKAIGGGLSSEQQNLGRQFKTAIDHARGFSDALRHNKGSAETVTAALKQMTGGAVGLETILQLTGENAGDFSKAVQKIADASGHAGKNVDNWSVVQHSFNFKLGQFHEQLNVLGIGIGQKLLPAVTSMVGGFTSAIPAIMSAAGWLERNKPVAIGLAVALGTVLVPALWGMATAAWAAAAGFIVANAEIIAAVVIIAAIAAAVVYAYQHWTWFRVAVQETGKAIKVAAEWMWDNGVKPVFNALKTYITSVVIPWWGFLWQAAKVAFSFVATYASFMWHNVVSPIFNLIKAYIGGIVIPWFMFLWTAAKTYFGAVGAVVSGLWHGIISPVFKLIVAVVKFTVETWWALFSFLWKHIWDDFGQPIYKFMSQHLPDWFRTGYKLLDQYFLQPWKLAFTTLYQWIWTDFGQKIYNFLVTTLPKWFQQGVQLLKHAWGSFAGAVLVPVNWVIQNVWNDGIEKIWNAAAGVFNGPTLSPVPMLAVAPGFASGGALPVQPGIFNRPTAIVGEGNPSYPEYVIPTDPKYRDRAAALWAAAGSNLQMLAGGGILGGIFGGIGNWLKGMVLGGLEKAASAAFGGVNALLGHIPGSGTEMGQLLIAAVKTGETDILKLLHKKDQASGGPVVAAAKSQLGVPYSWGGGGPYGPSYGFAQGAGIYGFDCSSLMQYAYWQGAKRMLPRTTYEQINVGKAIGSQGELLPGDLVFPEAGHVMMVATPGASGPAGMIEAPHTGLSVRMNSFYGMMAARRILGYRDGGFIGPGEVGLVGEVAPELVTGGRSGVTVHPIKGGDGSFYATLDIRLDGQTIDRQLVKFQHVGGTLQSSQNEIKRGVVASARNI